MSAKELSRLEVMQRLSRKQTSQKEAGMILGLSVRQIKRLLKAYREKGAAGLVSKQHGRKANNRLAEDVKKQALNLLKTTYKGFGPTLAVFLGLAILTGLLAWGLERLKSVFGNKNRVAS